MEIIVDILVVIASMAVCLLLVTQFKDMSRKQQTGCICCVIAFFGCLITVLAVDCRDYLETIIKLLEKQ